MVNKNSGRGLTGYSAKAKQHTLRELPGRSGEDLVLPFVRRHQSKAKVGDTIRVEGMGLRRRDWALYQVVETGRHGTVELLDKSPGLPLYNDPKTGETVWRYRDTK